MSVINYVVCCQTARRTIVPWLWGSQPSPSGSFLTPLSGRSVTCTSNPSPAVVLSEVFVGKAKESSDLVDAELSSQFLRSFLYLDLLSSSNNEIMISRPPASSGNPPWSRNNNTRLRERMLAGLIRRAGVGDLVIGARSVGVLSKA